FWTAAKAKSINGEAQIHAKVDGKKLVWAATTASSLEAKHDSGVKISWGILLLRLVNDQDDEQMIYVNDLQGKEVFIHEDVADKEVNDTGEVNAASIATTDSATVTMIVDETTNKSSKRIIMCTYLKNMEGWKPNSLKNKSFANIQELFNQAMKRVNTFVDYRTELVEESSKKAEAEVMKGSSKRAGTKLDQESSNRAGTELEQESFKKQKIDDDKKTAELKQLVKIIPDEEGVTIDAIPLAVKPPSIVD
nr:hypothetical protein [Tanacetum cinerariifolium]GEZ23529.1 hypothetical protein [Tanacetum cinerariifolium]